MPNRPGASPARRIRRGNPDMQEEIHDPYATRRKPRTPVACPECGAVCIRGHWSWRAPRMPQPVHALVCPACRRINDSYPAGEVTIAGNFALARASEALRIVDNVARMENRDHPLNRVMRVRKEPEVIRIETTDVHLPRRIGHALEAAWGGELHTHYDEQGYFARVGWRRDE